MHLLHTIFNLVVGFGEWIVSAVIIKYIIAHWIGERILKYSKTWFASTERNTAIWLHYLDRAAGAGHASDSVLDCHQGRCGIF